MAQVFALVLASHAGMKIKLQLKGGRSWAQGLSSVLFGAEIARKIPKSLEVRVLHNYLQENFDG